MQFTRDDSKRRSNLSKHGFDFADASIVVEGATFTYEDTRFTYGEQRWIKLGLLRENVVVIAHTEDSNEIRLISMRGGTKHEQAIFLQHL
ncbi:MAG: BrnT family toxin [Timaviella obliquedivisa GSE-PSE-MK23-08B]|jgi:hypothetical protein|nr:BrnT family toxin [Timaviella obliquedivisa GSE-PSE-MK23-08B]